MRYPHRHRLLIHAVLLLIVTGLVGRQPGDTQEPWTFDFSAAQPGPLTVAELAALSPAPVLWAEGFADDASSGRCRVVASPDGGHVLEVAYPAGGVGPQQTGAQWMAALSPRDDYTLVYRVRFSGDFDWVKGGKLPGLAGGETPSGGHYHPDGFTSRYMWRDDGRLVLYLYWAGQASSRRPDGAQYAEDLPTGVTLERGRIYELKQRVKLNTPGAPDGIVQVWVDGTLVLERTDLLFRVAPDRTWQIDRFFFSTFHGGNDATWAPRRDVTVQFSDFRVAP